jgi:hypothetical protein
VKIDSARESGEPRHAIYDCREAPVDVMTCEDVTRKPPRQVGGECFDVHSTPYPGLIRRHSTCFQAS